MMRIAIIAAVLLATTPVSAERNQGSGSPHYTEGQCRALWWEIWEHYRNFNDYWRSCDYGDTDSCRYAGYEYQLYVLSLLEYRAAGCEAYELEALPNTPVIISLPEPVLTGSL